MVNVSRLVHHPANPNIGNVDAIVASMHANGFYGALIVQRSTQHVLAGNHTLKAAKQLRMRRVPVIYVEVDDAHALRILVADNRTAELSHRDPTALLAILDDLGRDATTLAGVGFSLDDVEDLRRLTQPPDAAAPRASVTGAAAHFDVLVSFTSEREQRTFFETMQREGRPCKLLL